MHLSDEHLGLLGLRPDIGDRGRRHLVCIEPMNPVPSDSLWLILYQVDDGEVVVDGPGRWKAKGSIGWFQCTGAIRRLYGLGLVNLDKEGNPSVNKDGMEVLKRRSVYEVLERINRRSQ